MVDARLPATAFPDALHIAIAADHGVEFLLTWNCRHIANAEILPTIARICRRFQVETPAICTPEELLGGAHVN